MPVPAALPCAHELANNDSVVCGPEAPGGSAPGTGRLCFTALGPHSRVELAAVRRGTPETCASVPLLPDFGAPESEKRLGGPELKQLCLFCVAVTATPSDGEAGRTQEDTFGVSFLPNDVFPHLCCRQTPAASLCLLKASLPGSRFYWLRNSRLSEVGKLRPGGRMWPDELLNPARGALQSYIQNPILRGLSGASAFKDANSKEAHHSLLCDLCVWAPARWRPLSWRSGAL